MLPRAYIVHRIQGRTRLRIPDRRKDLEYFDALSKQLESHAAVGRLSCNPLTATVLVEHAGEPRELGQAGVELELFELSNKPATPPLSRLLYEKVSAVNTHLEQASHGQVDASGLAILALTGLGVMKVAQGHALPAGWSMLWHASRLLTAAGKQSEPTVVYPPGQVGKPN